ncbi:mannose-6-phosphate isomerase, class I [uncultured Bifidobacterium sp.]|uniref:mannose-6-phosphate isomerase, class I n=1 Tax=uncultured Bifidobacterium sp. TaxID=165187 RepID=UPI002582BC9A|nr:mannose-6-phosphate isomerase, class I [uncultured Bifidobacterium sp.]MEE0654917.1 mannose-6-phosphate isomerase, class I [Bifidobacterium criceti]
MYTIHPVPKRYAWGSRSSLQRMFHLDGADAQGPLAEMWFSGHAQSPSMLDMPSADGTTRMIALTDAIAQDPDGMVGARGANEFGPVLPFLFKTIAADEPLSLQVHPVGFQARAGFNIENRQGIALDAPERSFKDMNAKSEMVVALEPFLASVGFASHSFALRNLQLLRSPIAQRMVDAFASGGRHGDDSFADADMMMPVAATVWPESRKRIFRAFQTAVTAPASDPDALIDDINTAAAHATHSRNIMAFDFALRAARAFPGDTSVLALLMMNPVRLEEGESVFLPTGVPHAYIYGTGAEIMTNSDNVLRAGMTVKHKDIMNLLQCVDCRPTSPVNPSDARLGALLMRDVVFYKPGVSEYVLAYGHVDDTRAWPIVERLAVRYDALVQQMRGRAAVPHAGPRVLLCTQGEVVCTTQTDTRTLRQGEAVFIPAADGGARISGTSGSYLMASTPF